LLVIIYLTGFLDIVHVKVTENMDSLRFISCAVDFRSRLNKLREEGDTVRIKHAVRRKDFNKLRYEAIEHPQHTPLRYSL
jgi:hypothetical protein